MMKVSDVDNVSKLLHSLVLRKDQLRALHARSKDKPIRVTLGDHFASYPLDENPVLVSIIQAQLKADIAELLSDLIKLGVTDDT